MAQYAYEPLDLLDNPSLWNLYQLRSIRLLTLLSGNESSRIQCLLSHAKLPKDFEKPSNFSSPKHVNKAPPALPYEALSYVWGDPTVTHEIDIRPGTAIEESDDPFSIVEHAAKNVSSEGWMKFNVTANLMTALKYLRMESKARLLWVDAICIDQNNNAEKSQQVAIMDRIYAQATQTSVFLGEPAQLNGLEHEDGPSKYAKPGITDAEVAFDVIESLCENVPVLPVERKQGRAALIQLLLRPWWKRGWVVQEVLMARTCTFMCGHHTLDWNKMGLGIHQLDPFPSDWVTEWSTKGSEWNKPMLWMMKANMGAFTILYLPYLLAHLGNRYCTDPRDKIFSLSSMVAGGPNVRPNYEKSVRDVYIEATEKCVLHKPNLSIITRHHRGFNPDGPNSHSLPSWVPDFSQSIGDGRLSWTVSTDWYFRDLYYADGRFQFEGITDFTFLDPFLYHGAMLGQGARIDCIKTITDAIPDEAYADDTWKYLIQKWEPHEVTSKQKYELTGEPAVRAYWRTLVADRHSPNWRYSHLSESHAPLWEADFAYNVLAGHASLPLHRGLGMSPMAESCQKFENMVKDITKGRRFAVTERGYMALVGEYAKVGDILAVLLGGSAPFVLREIKGDSEDAGMFTMTGISYVHGWMDGRLTDQLKADEVEGEFFPIN